MINIRVTSKKRVTFLNSCSSIFLQEEKSEKWKAKVQSTFGGP